MQCITSFESREERQSISIKRPNNDETFIDATKALKKVLHTSSYVQAIFRFFQLAVDTGAFDRYIFRKFTSSRVFHDAAGITLQGNLVRLPCHLQFMF